MEEIIFSVCIGVFVIITGFILNASLAAEQSKVCKKA
ncbi:hypothetical protein LMG7974_01829 [Campylobacter majalis]|uniref:Uncharacterized protein n=1 Tax=Campylobacter majalis TaxID=2790656 RepID=A0ABM8Q9T3_9BACT|nr:hypothetical protein LMG7974_01829 [Campylobacter majalis]